MTAKVIAWPPVGAVGVEWTEVAPVQISRSAVTGAERVSGFQRKRRMATVSVASIGRSTYDGGYMEMLKRYLEGVHLVRLNSYPVAWHMDRPERVICRGDVFTDKGQTFVRVYGLKRSQPVCRPADFLTLFLPTGTDGPGYPLDWVTPDGPLAWETPATDTVAWFTSTPYGGTTVQVTRPVSSDDSGQAVVPVFESVADQTQIYLVFGACATGVFRPVVYPRAVQPQSGNWTYDWEFREVFEDEVGGFTEVNPWAR